MAYPNRGLLKAAMGHYLTESARTALEALEPEEDVVELGPGKRMPAVGPNQILDMPLFTKMPFLPGSNTMFYTTNLGEKLYQPSATFDLSDPYCKIMVPMYKSLHDPHLRAYYKRKDNLRRLKKAGYITDKNKVVCSLKEFNEYRQYLTSLKLEFEKHYIREQKMLEKQITKLHDAQLLPEGIDTSKYRDWLLKEERPTIPEQESAMRNRYLELINQELEKLEQLAEENRRLSLAQDDKKKLGLEQRKQLLLRKKMEEEWRKKEMMLLMKIGDDVKREARIEEQWQKSKEEKLKRKQAMLEKKMAYHLKKLQEKFQKEGFLPPDRFLPVAMPDNRGPSAKKLASLRKKSTEGPQKSADSEKKQGGPVGEKGAALPKAGRASRTEPVSQASRAEPTGGAKQSLTVLVPSASSEMPAPSRSANSLEPGIVEGEKDVSKQESQESETAGEPLPPQAGNSKVSLASGKEAVSMASSAISNTLPGAEADSSVVGSSNEKVLPSVSGGAVSNEGAVSVCGSAGCGSKTSCCGSAGCGSKKSCCGSAGCGSKASCCGSTGRGSKTSCCGSAGCGSKTSCCGSGGCGSKKSCCGSAGCGSQASCSGSGCGSGGRCGRGGKCCGSGGCGSNNSKGTGDYDSSGSSKHGATGKLQFTSLAGVTVMHQSSAKPSTKTTMPPTVTAQTVSETSGKGKQKKKTTLTFSQSEPDPQPKERGTSKKRRADKNKIEHLASTSQDNDSESSYSAYLQRLLSNSDHSALRESLKGKVSVSELNSIIQNIMTWVVSAVTSILYPALTKFEERVRTRVYTISEESLLSSDNSSSCSTCNEDLFEAYGGLPSLSTRKVSFTDTSLKPTTSNPSEFQAASRKPTSVISSKSSYTSFTKSTHLSLDGDLFKGKFKRGKAAIFFSPAKHGRFVSSTTASMRSSKSDSHIFEMQKAFSEAPEKPAAAYHGKRSKGAALRGLFPKVDTTTTAATVTTAAAATTTTTDTGLPPPGREHKPPRGPSDPKETLNLRDLKSILAELKSPLSKVTAVVLNDVFKRILGDLGCTASAVSLAMEVLLESISESILGSPPGGSPPAGSISRIASFVATDLVENVLNKIQATAQKKYVETVSRDEFSAECKAMCVAATGKRMAPDPASWKARMPLSLESMHSVAEEILHFILDKLKVFALTSQTKVSQFELFARIKAVGIPLEQFYTAIPLHTVESEAANAIVKDTIRKIVSKTVASSDTNILQYVEEMISSILSYIQSQLSPEGKLPTRESSILLQLINDVFNSLSTEKLRGIFPAAKPRASPPTQGEVPSPEPSAAPEAKATTVTTTTLFSAEKKMKKPFSPVNVPGMVIYSEAEVEGREKKEPDGTLSSVNEERKVSVTEEAQDRVRYESSGLESHERSRPHPKRAPQGEEDFLDKDTKTEPKHLDKTESSLENFVQEAIFCSVEGHQTVMFPADPKSGAVTGEWTLEKALKKLEEDFKEGERSPVVSLVRNLLNKTFQLVWAEQPVWPPKTPPSSLAHACLGRQQAEGQAASKGRPEVGALRAPVSEADVNAFASDLVKTAFRKISRATQTDTRGAGSRHSSLVITDILPLKVPAETGKSPLTVHFRDPETGLESGGPPQGGAEAPAALGDSTQEQNLPSRPDLASDLVQTFITKLECFVTSKVESQLCLDVQNLKTSMSSDFSSAIQQELRRILVNSQGCLPSCLDDILSACGSSALTEKEKGEYGLPLSYSQLKSYAQEVARMLLKNLKRGLDREVEKIPTPPVIFSESIAASQIVTMVFTIVAPREYECEEGFPRGSPCKESVLEKLLRKNATYKSELQLQIQNTVETFLNEIYQTILLDMGVPPSVGAGGSQASKETDDSAPPPLSKCVVVKSDISVVSGDLVDIVLKDLSSGLAAALHKKGPLSTRLQALLYELVQKTVEPFSLLTGRGAKAGHKSHFPDFDMGRHQVPGLLKGESGSGRTKTGEDGAKEFPELRDLSPEGIARYLVDNVVLRLERFAQEKLEAELTLGAPQPEKRASYRQRAKLAVQDSQSNLRLCAEKLTCTILKVIQKDLEREMLSCQNILPYEENASANDVMNDLLKILSVQIALTENEVHKRVLKRIFRRQPQGERGRFPLLGRVEDVLNQVTQRIMGELGHLPAFSNDSTFMSSEGKSSHYHGLTEASSQANTGSVAGEIVDSVLGKMYAVVVDNLFSSSESKSELDSSSSDRGLLFTDLMGKSDLQKMTLALAQLHPPPQSVGEELVQSVLNKIACFAASNLEEVLPLSAQPRQRVHASLRYGLQGGDGVVACRPIAFSDDSESSLLKVNLSKSDLTVYAKDVVSKVLGNIIDEFKMEDYHRAILRVNTLSSEQISIASDLVRSIAQDLHVTKHSKADGPASTQLCFRSESSVKRKPTSLFYEDFSSFLKQVLPKEGILREIFEQQPLTDANINETLKMLQVAENIVSEVFMRTRDLEPSVCILRKTPGELSERLFCYGFKRAEGPGLFHSDSQAEIGSVARDIVASVFENVHKCLICSVPSNPERECFPPRKDRVGLKGPARGLKHRFTQPEFPFYNVSLKSAMDTIDKIAKEAVECVVLMLETFIIRHFRRDFRCNFLEIVKFPLESLSFAQLTRSLDSLSTQVGNVAETTVEAFKSKLQGASGRGALPTLGSSPNFMDFSKLGGAVTRECIETAIRQVQTLHSELSVYANNAVSGILEIIKHTLDRELSQKEPTLFSSSSDSLILSETISVMLDRCNESLTEITSELMVDNLQLEMSGRAFAKEKSLLQDLVAPPVVKTTTKKYRRVDTRDSFPPINVPGMVIYSEEEIEVQEETPSKFPSVFKYSEWDARGAPERCKGTPLCSSTPRSRPPARRRQERSSSRYRVDFLEDDYLPRESSIPEGSILEKLFKKAAESEPAHRLTKTGSQSKAGALSQPKPFGRGLRIPENVCYSAICPLKLGQTAETIVNTLLCEFGLENEAGQSNGCEKCWPRSPLKEKTPLATSGSLSTMFADMRQKWPSLLNRWERRMSDSSERIHTTVEESGLLIREGSSLLSKWESKHCLFRSQSPERPKEMELLACSHVPDPCEIHLLANHIVLSVIKELIFFQPKDASDKKVPAWKQELVQSESKWLQERIWRSTYLPTLRRQSSCLEIFWEPLTLAVVSNVLLSISRPGARHSLQGRNEFFDGSVSMFCSIDACCPEHGPRVPPKSCPINIEELAFRISEVIVGLLCDRHVLHAGIKWKGCLAKRTRYIYVPPLCLADFDDVYHPLVKEVSNLLSLELDMRGKVAGDGKARDLFWHHQQQQSFVSPRCFSRLSRGDCRGPGDLKGASCLSTLGQLAHKNQRLNCVATNLDNFICSLKSSEAKHLVNKILHVILDSLWPEQLPEDLLDGQSQNVMPYREAGLATKRPLFYSSVCPHAYRLSDSVMNSNLGLSPKSVILLDIVSEKLIRALLDKCLMTEHFTGTFAFDEFPEDEQLCDIRKCVSDEELLQYSRREVKSYERDANSSVFTYDIKYTEEPSVEAQSGASSYESALDLLAHTLVKPVMMELSLSLENPDHLKAFSKKSVGFSQSSSRRPHGQTFSKKYMCHGRSEGYSSLPRGKKPESKGPSQGKRQGRKSTQDRNRTVLEMAMQHRGFGSRLPAHTRGRPAMRTTCTKKTYRREVVTMSGRGDHRQLSPAFSAIYSASFLEEVVSRLLIKIFSSLQSRYDRETCMSLREMNVLFVNALVEEFRKAGVGVLRKTEEKTYFPQLDDQVIDKITDSILREFGFQLAADRDFGRSVETMAERAAEIIRVEILDYQLPPVVCQRLPLKACKNVKPERILLQIEHCISFPKAHKRRPPPPPTYVTVLSQKYLERVINRLLTQLFPPPPGPPQKPDRRELPGEDFDELCAYIIKEVMRSISKHKIWVAKKDDRCRLHSEKEIQSMVDSVYHNMLRKSGSQLSVQKEVKSRDAALIDNITSFVIQEITKHHLQTFLSKDEFTSRSPDPEALSENIVRTVLESIGQPSASRVDVFPAKFLEEIVSRVLSKVLRVSGERKETTQGPREAELAHLAKRLASSINSQFGQAALTGGLRGTEQSLGAPLTDIMDDVVESVCDKISRERDIPGGELVYAGEGALFENIKRLVEKCIADYLLHPLFSGDVFKNFPSSCEDATKNVRDMFEENESPSPFSTFLSSGFLKDLISGLLSRIFPSAPPGDAASPWEKRLPSESELNKLSIQLLNDIRMKLLKHEIRVTRDTPPEQYEYSEEDVQNMTDSLCSKIIEKSGSLEAVQREVRNKSNALIDWIAGSLVGDILQQHIRPFVARDEPPPWDGAAAGDSMGGIQIYRTTIKPKDLRQTTQEKVGGAPSSSFLGDIISELLSKLSATFSDIPLGASGDDTRDTAVRLAKSLTKELTKAQLSIREGPEEQLGSAPPPLEDRNMADQHLPGKGPRQSWPLKEHTADGRDTSLQQTATVVFEEAVDHLLQSACPSKPVEGWCLIQEKMMDELDGAETRPPAAYTTVISYPVLESIVERLLSQIFPSDAMPGDGPLGSDRQERVAQIKRAILEMVLKQAIWASTYGSINEMGIEDEALERMVESVYCDVLHEVLLRQPFPEDRESLSNLYITQIACFIVNEMFKYHLQSLSPEGDSCLKVFPCRLLEDMLNQLLDKIFPSPESIAAYVGNQADFLESDFVEMAVKLKSYVITEILAHEIKLENLAERVPDMDHETEEDIANSVYNQVLQKYPSLGDLQNAFAQQGYSGICEAASSLVREILNFHLHPFLSSSDSSNSESTKWQKERQLFSRRIYSAVFLEDIVVAFFCKILSSPNILAYSKDTSLSEHEMRSLVIELVNALVAEFKMLEVKVIQSMEEDSSFPQIAPEVVVQISNSIYEKLLQQLGSELEIFKAFQNNTHMLAEKLAPLMIREIAGYQLLPLFTGDTSPYLFSFLEAETIVDRVETILPEATSPRSIFGEMFVKILGRIFPSWASGILLDAHDSPALAGVTKRSLPTVPVKEEADSDAPGNVQSLVENISKTVCGRSGSPERKYEGASEEFAGFFSKTGQGDQPPSRSHPSSTLIAKSAGWTIHHVRLGEGESKPMQIEEGADVYSSSFLKDIFSGLVSKLLSSTASVCAQEKREPDTESLLKSLVESILREFAKSPVKVLQVPEGGQVLPAVGKTEVAKIIHATLCDILQDWESGVPFGTDKLSQHALAERLASAIKKEILDYQIQGSTPRAPQESAFKPFELGEMAKKVMVEVKKITTPSPTAKPHPLLVSQRFIHDVLAFLLSKILPLPTGASTSTGTDDQCAEFDFIHMKLLSKVMAELAKDKNTDIQYLDRVQPNRVVSQTVANSVYNSLLPEFGTTSTVEKCIRAGCTILLERIVDFVIKEISGNKMQAYFSEEQNRQQTAIKAEREMEQQYGAGPEPPEGETTLRSHLRGLSSIILEEVAAKLLSKMFHSLSLDDVDESSLASVKEVAKKIISSLQGFISKNKLQVWEDDEGGDLDSEESQTVGELVDSVYTDILKHSSSETSLYEDLTNKNEDLVNRVACFVVSEISRRDFHSGSESEEDLPHSSTSIELKSDKIIRKFLDDIEMEKARKETTDIPSPMVPVDFLEEILSRFLTTIFIEQYDLGIHERKSLSKTEVNEIAALLKTSVEKEMSKNKIGLVASGENQPKMDPQYEERVNQVVHSVISNVMEKSGSQQELYNDMTTNQVIFPEQVASIIINEISSCNITNPPGESAENETRSALELDRIVSKVIARVSCHMEPEEEESLLMLTAPPEMPEEAIPEIMFQSEELPVKIVPYIGHRPLKIDPDIIADHLAVLSIKTEPLEKLKKTCLSKIGISLTELRRASASGKSITNELGIPAVTDVQRRKERRPSLDMAGRLGVRPKEAVCRNSFQSLMKPDITKVELLKDVESKQDLIVRLVAHDIDEEQIRRSWAEESDDEEEQVLTEHHSFYFEVPPLAPRPKSTMSSAAPAEPPVTKASGSGILRRRWSGAVDGPGTTGEEEAATGLSEPAVAPQAAGSHTREATEEAFVPGSSSSQTGSSTTVPVAIPSQEESLEKAVVDMHLSRDTEETSGPLEITSVYQDKKFKDSISEEHSEVEDGKVIAVTSSDAVVPLRQRSSVFEKVSGALSRVFSRTSTSNLARSASGHEKAAGD